MSSSSSSLVSGIFFCVLFFGKCGAVFRSARPGEVVGNLTIRFVSYANPSHVISTGAGCDLGWFGSKECDPRFTICFLHTETSWNSNNTEAVEKCDFAGPFHCGPYDNAGKIKFADMLCNYANPMVLNISQAWLGAEMRVRVDEMERGSFLGSNTAVGALIDNFSYFFNARPALDNVMKLKLLGFTKANTTLVIEAQIRCLPNYYDVKCSTFCLASARYDCDRKTGMILCKTGWSGDNCTARSVSDQLTIHPLSFGSQVDEMIVYEVQAAVGTENVTSSTPGDLGITMAAVAAEPSGSTVAPPESTESENQPRFDKQSGENTSDLSEKPAAAKNGVASFRSTTLSSIWPLTVSLVVGGISVYATTSSPSPAADVNKIPTPSDIRNVAETTVDQTAAAVAVQSLTGPTLQSTRETNPEATEAEASQNLTTTEVTETSVVFMPATTTTTLSFETTNDTENSTLGETAAPPVVNFTSMLPNPDWSQSTRKTHESLTTTVVTTTASHTKFDVSTSNIGPTTTALSISTVEMKTSVTTEAETSSTMTSGATTSTDSSTPVIMNNSIETSNLPAVRTPTPVNLTQVSLTRKEDMVAIEDEILMEKTTLNMVNSESVEGVPTHSTEGIVYSTSDSSMQAPSIGHPSQNTSTEQWSSTKTPTEVLLIENVDSTDVVSGSLFTDAPSVVPPSLTRPVLDNTVIISSNKTSENVSHQGQKVRFRTFQLPSRLRFPEPLTNIGLLDQLNASVYDATEALLKKQNVSGDYFRDGLKTAVEFTGISINSSAVVPQITLYASLSGKPVLSDLEFEIVLENALINLRQNATVAGIPYSIGNANYASNHPVMVFLIALLSVAIVVLIGIIMVLMRKPKAGRCETLGPLSDHLDLSSSFDSFSSTSAYDNLAFSEPRLHFVSDDEIVSLEPSVSSHTQTAQERLFARRVAVHSIGSPTAMPRVPADFNRTITTFTKPTGNTI